MVKHKNMVPTSPYKNTKNISIHGKIFTKCLLNTGRSHTTKAEKRSPHNQIGSSNNNNSNLDETCNPERE